MKTFESLFAELSEKAVTKPEGSLTVDELAKGTHFIGKKIIEEAGETWIAAEYEGADVDDLELAYCISVHKSQGSEFPAVILPVAQVPPRLCYRNLFYTGVTRARRLCVVAGRRDVVNSMMSNIRQNLRYSGLCALLQAGQSPQQLSTEGESP